MGKPVDPSIKQQEAEALKRLILTRVKMSNAAFAEAAHIRGGRAMLHQHITAEKPISLEAAKLPDSSGFFSPTELAMLDVVLEWLYS